VERSKDRMNEAEGDLERADLKSKGKKKSNKKRR
jgi:hypothetical protein